MTSERKKAANRRNAKKSTGPCTAEGKARVKNNARRHGLASSAMASAAMEEIEALAVALAGAKGKTDGALMFFARRAAEAQVALSQVRALKTSVVDKIARGEVEPRSRDSLDVATKELSRLERYERRSVSRRNTAFRKIHATWDERLKG